MGGHRRKVHNSLHDLSGEQSESKQAGTDERIKALIEIVVESWRLNRFFDELLVSFDVKEQSRCRNRLQWYRSKMQESLQSVGMRLVNMEGHPFDTGMAVTPINNKDFMPGESLVVDQMLEPIIMGPDGILKSGTVRLRKAEP